MLYSVFIGHLPNTTTKEELTELFSECGEVRDVYIHPDTQRPFGYGFVRFPNPESVLKAAQEVGDWTLRGFPLKVEIASESKDTLKLVLDAKHPTSRTVKKDNTVRSRVKESCHCINKELDLVHGDAPLHSKSVLDRMEAMSSGYSPRLTGTPVPRSFTTMDNLRDRIASGMMSDPDPQESQGKKVRLKESLKTLLSDLEVHYAEIVIKEKDELNRSAGEAAGDDSSNTGEEVTAKLPRLPRTFRTLLESTEANMSENACCDEESEKSASCGEDQVEERSSADVTGDFSHVQKVHNKTSSHRKMHKIVQPDHSLGGKMPGMSQDTKNLLDLENHQDVIQEAIRLGLEDMIKKNKLPPGFLEKFCGLPAAEGLLDLGNGLGNSGTCLGSLEATVRGSSENRPDRSVSHDIKRNSDFPSSLESARGGPRQSPPSSESGRVGPRQSPSSSFSGRGGPRQSPSSSLSGRGGPRQSPPSSENGRVGPRQSPSSSLSGRGGPRQSPPSSENGRVGPRQSPSSSLSERGGPRQSPPSSENGRVGPRQSPSSSESGRGGPRQSQLRWVKDKGQDSSGPGHQSDPSRNSHSNGVHGPRSAENKPHSVQQNSPPVNPLPHNGPLPVGFSASGGGQNSVLQNSFPTLAGAHGKGHSDSSPQSFRERGVHSVSQRANFRGFPIFQPGHRPSPGRGLSGPLHPSAYPVVPQYMSPPVSAVPSPNPCRKPVPRFNGPGHLLKGRGGLLRCDSHTSSSSSSSQATESSRSVLNGSLPGLETSEHRTGSVAAENKHTGYTDNNGRNQQILGNCSSKQQQNPTADSSISVEAFIQRVNGEQSRGQFEDADHRTNGALFSREEKMGRSPSSSAHEHSLPNGYSPRNSKVESFHNSQGCSTSPPSVFQHKMSMTGRGRGGVLIASLQALTLGQQKSEVGASPGQRNVRHSEAPGSVPAYGRGQALQSYLKK
ncbi:hornerin-like [Littorina saxatilis]|uniref:RRM domain-containing protein n=1 Tax=Littorina saxatilis TaxID=31220 RepID=A0AAN9B4K4_9CAEN